MFSSNTETRISATYEDGDGTIDLVVDDMTANDNTQLSDAQVRSKLSAGTGISYNNSTGVFSYTPPSTVTFANISGKPTTVSGYGITDALTTGADANIGSNDFITTGKAYFANMFANVSDGLDILLSVCIIKKSYAKLEFL